MNPLDKLELSFFMRNLNKEMPIHTPTSLQVKRTYQQFPKNLSEYSAFVDNHFLNDNLAIIEEMAHRDKRHPIPQWFRNYQLRYFSEHGLFKGDGFFKMIPKEFHHHASLTMHNVGFIGRASVRLGAELEVYLNTDVDDEVGTTQLLAHVMSSNANIGDIYNQVAIKRGTSGTGGNYRMAIYQDDNSTPKPASILGETGSLAIPATSTYTYQSLSNGGGAAVYNKMWASIQNDASGKKMARHFSLSSNAHLYGNLSYSYAAPPSTWTGSYHETTNNFRLKIKGA